MVRFHRRSVSRSAPRRGSHRQSSKCLGPLDLPVDVAKVERVVEVVQLQLAAAGDVEVVHDEELFVYVGGLYQRYSRGRPYARAAPEGGAGDRVPSNRVAGDRPDLVGRRGGRHDGVPEVPVVGIGAHVHERIVTDGDRAPGGDLNDRVDSVLQRVRAQELLEEVVVASGEAEAAVPEWAVEHEAIVQAA